MPSTDIKPPGPGETVIRRTTTRYSGKVPWLPLIAAALLIPLLLTVLATCTSLGERDPIETDLTSRTEAALAAAGVDGAKVAFEGRDATVSGVPAGQEEAAKKAVEGVNGVRIAEVSSASAGSGADTGEEAEAAPSAADKAALQKKIDALLESKKITFDAGKDSLTDASDALVQKIAAAVKEVPGAQLSVEGHVAARKGAGSPDFQQAFSERRAEIVKERLVELGISGDQISTKGLGATKPIADRSTPEGLAANRRVEINVL